MNENPYAAPVEDFKPGYQQSEAEQVRRTHLNAEANITGLGLIYLIGGILATIGIVTNPTQTQAEPGSAEATGYLIGTILFPLCFLVLGYGLRKLNAAARIIAGILSSFGLFAVPVGTAISIVLLYILFCKKGRFVTTPAYEEIIAKTPHVKRKTSIVVWIFLALLLLILAGGVFFILRATH